MARFYHPVPHHHQCSQARARCVGFLYSCGPTGGVLADSSREYYGELHRRLAEASRRDAELLQQLGSAAWFKDQEAIQTSFVRQNLAHELEIAGQVCSVVIQPGESRTVRGMCEQCCD